IGGSQRSCQRCRNLHSGIGSALGTDVALSASPVGRSYVLGHTPHPPPDFHFRKRDTHQLKSGTKTSPGFGNFRRTKTSRHACPGRSRKATTTVQGLAAEPFGQVLQQGRGFLRPQSLSPLASPALSVPHAFLTQLGITNPSHFEWVPA